MRFTHHDDVVQGEDVAKAEGHIKQARVEVRSQIAVQSDLERSSAGPCAGLKALYVHPLYRIGSLCDRHTCQTMHEALSMKYSQTPVKIARRQA